MNILSSDRDVSKSRSQQLEKQKSNVCERYTLPLPSLLYPKPDSRIHVTLRGSTEEGVSKGRVAVNMVRND